MTAAAKANPVAASLSIGNISSMKRNRKSKRLTPRKATPEYENAQRELV
jgi:hypothetical protein